MKKVFNKTFNIKISDRDAYTVIAVLLAIILIGTIITVSGVNLGSRQDQEPKAPPFVTTYYDLAIDAADKKGRMPDDFIPSDMKRGNFRLDYDKTVISVDNDWRITLKDNISAGAKTVVKARLGRSDIYAIANIVIVNADIIVTSAEEFLQLPDSGKTIVVANTLDFTLAEGNVDSFSGKIYFNHHPFVNIKADNFPLFDSLDSAQVTGVSLDVDIAADDTRALYTDLSNSEDATDYAKVFGVVAGRADKTRFENVTLAGSVNFEIKDGEKRYYIGGLAGFLNDRRRILENDIGISVSQNIRVYLNIEVFTALSEVNDIECGSLFGIIKNASLQTVVAQGRIDTVAQGSTLKRVSAGGIFGSLIKEYDSELGHDFYTFDTMKNLYGKVEVFILANALEQDPRVGGIGAYAQNVNLDECVFDTLVSVKTDNNMTESDRAAIVAKALNSLSGFSMTLNGEDWSIYQ